MGTLARWFVLCVWLVAVGRTHAVVKVKVRNATINLLLTGQQGIIATLGVGSKFASAIDSAHIPDPTEFSVSVGKSTTFAVHQIDKTCSEVSWTSKNITADDILQFTDCFDFGKKHWYGGPERAAQYWPYEKLSFPDNSFISKEDRKQAIADPFWFNSDGVYILVDEETHLFLNQKNLSANHMCLIGRNGSPYPEHSVKLQLKYKVCKLSNAREAHEHAIQNYIGKPTDIPDERMIRHPIWSTFVMYKTLVNETDVLQFADEINKHGFNNSQIEIDAAWETCYGSTVFDTKKFPNALNLSSVLKNKGFRLTLWIQPFIDRGCNPGYDVAAEKGYFVKNTTGSTVAKWWSGVGGAVDFTKTEAADWWVRRLRNLSQVYKIDSFKFDAGESNWLPQSMILNSSDEVNPMSYSSSYLRTVAQFGPMVEVRSAARTQDLPIFLRMVDKNSIWSINNGLRAIVTSLLQMNSVGYYFVLPDMIGGNAYRSDKITKELLIRWLQANTFMPTLQLSYPPWEFDNETVEICKKFTSLHYQYSDVIIKLAKQATKTGAPINPPIWWIDPEDVQAQTVGDEYLLGEDILVAPVMSENATSRDIYLPKGSWKDELHPNKAIIKGRTWLRNYSASLSELPYFTRVSA